MTENLLLDQDALFEEVVEKGRDEGVSDKDGYVDLVEYVVYEKQAVGEEDVADPIPELVEHLKGRFNEYKTRIEERA